MLKNALTRLFQSVSGFFSSTPTDPYLRIRFSTPDDVEKIVKFYDDNKHMHLYERKADIWEDRARNGRIILVEDNEKNIGFTSVAFDFEHDGKFKWSELGSTVNQQDPNTKPYELIKGVNLYPSLVACQTIGEFLQATPEDKAIASIFDDNPAVIHMLTKRAGWRFFEPEQAIKGKKQDTIGAKSEHDEVAKNVWLHASTDTLPFQARLVLDLIKEGEEPGLWNKVTEKHIKLDSSSLSLANEFRSHVEALASGPLADQLENNPHIGWKQAKELLETHLKKHTLVPAPTL